MIGFIASIGFTVTWSPRWLSAINHNCVKLRAYFWVAKRMPKRLISKSRDINYEGIKSSQTKRPVEGESVNTTSVNLTVSEKANDFELQSREDYWNGKILLFIGKLLCALETKRRTFSQTIKFLKSGKTIKHQIFKVRLLSYLLFICILIWLFIHSFSFDSLARFQFFYSLLAATYKKSKSR